MKLVLIISLFSLSSVFGSNFQGRLNSPEPEPSYIRQAPPRSKPPKQWQWNDVNGVNYLTLSRNQHLPLYCGSCWAHAVTSSLSDRIKIARKAAWPDINIAPQVLVSCGPGDGCHGGFAGNANEWMHKNWITDETCSIYRARGQDNGLPCSDLEVCENCMSFDSSCKKPKHYYRYKVDEFGPIEGGNAHEQEANMMAEIYHRGPISCGIAVPDALMNYTGGIFHDKTGVSDPEHDISVVGYGVENGEKYWLVRNSWGNYWGESGFFRLARGVNNIGIEAGHCVWATPLDTWTNAAAEREQILSNEISLNEPFLDKLFKLVSDFIKHAEKKSAVKGCIIRRSASPPPQKIKSPLPTQTVTDDELPDNWDWRNINGTNYVSFNVNQHIPHYCGSCWSQGTMSALADRFSIADHKKYSNLALSPQMIVNCHFGGTCHGGDPYMVYKYVYEYGVPDWTCQPYTATDTDNPSEGCVSKTSVPDAMVCKDCGWPPAEPHDDKGHCWPRKADYKKYRVTEFGAVLGGAKAMKKEIYKRGSIGCGIMVTDKFLEYTGGIYSEKSTYPTLNHELSVVGYGKDPQTGEEYWIGRNSWGTYWGEYGFFRIKMHQDNLGIESNCVWAVPDLKNF